MPPTPPPFSGDFFIQSSHDPRTSGIARVVPRSDSASRFQFIAMYFGDMGCASRTHQPPGSRRASISAAHPADGIRAFTSLTSESVSLFPRSCVNARYRTDGWSGSSSQSRTLSRGTLIDTDSAAKNLALDRRWVRPDARLVALRTGIDPSNNVASGIIGL